MPAPYLLLLALAAIYGWAWIVSSSKISLPFREWVARQTPEDSLFLTLIECPVCLSFHGGWIAGAFVFGLGFFGCIALALVATTFAVLLEATQNV